jgi:hypothetical protein
MKRIYTLVILLSVCGVALAQIPNPSFELWDTFATYKSPKNWGNLDSLTACLPTPVFTCAIDSPGISSSYYMKLTSRYTPAGVVPGVAVSGKIDYTARTPKSGFPFTSRPQSLTGKWQYMAWPGDQGFISVFLSKWNTTTNKRDTIGYVYEPLNDMVMIWFPFTINLKYYSGANPDSAMIVLSSSGPTPVDYSYLWVDSLEFAGSVPVGTITLGSAMTSEHSSPLSIYPNPASANTCISYYSNSISNAQITISDITGKKIGEMHVTAFTGENKFSVNTSGFTPGCYSVTLTTEQGIIEKKLIIEQ